MIFPLLKDVLEATAVWGAYENVSCLREEQLYPYTKVNPRLLKLPNARMDGLIRYGPQYAVSTCDHSVVISAHSWDFLVIFN